MKEKHEFRSLISGFIKSVKHFPLRQALVVNDEKFTYRQLGQIVSRIAATIGQSEQHANPFVAILAYRSITAYASVLGVLASGKGYVPLNPKFPMERIRKMLILSGSGILLVGKESIQKLVELLDEIERPLTIILPNVSDTSGLSTRFPGHQFISSIDMCKVSGRLTSPKVTPESFAYLLFTSGSSGEPKGVPVSQMNVVSYVQYVCNRYQVNEHDRVSQVFNLTFDLSVHDMFVCWERGACLMCVPEKYVVAPSKFIRDRELTVWFSVPSVLAFMSKMRILKPGFFPSLRCSLFCGEPLPATSAEAWQRAAPNSIVENLYGPTEATIAITHYRWEGVRSLEKCVNGIVPIGWVFEGQRSCVIDRERKVLASGEIGELCLAGSQVTNGYWNRPQKTKDQFIRLPSMGKELWYRTGDLVKEDENGCMHYMGRIDSQVKVLGHRVELQEIDLVLRNVSGTEQAVSLAWPLANGSADGIVAFICSSRELDEHRIMTYCKRFLPNYMVPRKIYFLHEMPLNANGKIDRLKLTKRLRNQGA